MADVKETLRRVLSERDGLEGLRVMSVKESPCTKPGDNFTSAVSVADVEGILPGGVPYSNRVFLKRPMENPVFKEFAKPDQAFANEAAMYMKVLPLYDVTMPCPRCYHADKDLIILEDLGKLGYKMADRTKGLDLDTARKVIKALARFHVASYLSKGEMFQLARGLMVPVGSNSESSTEALEEMLRRLLTQLEGVDDLREAVGALTLLKGRVFETSQRLRRQGKIAVLAHGDFWINNIMCKSENGKTADVKFVDLQACAVSSPAVDLWTFIYSSLDPSVFENCIDEIVEDYCKYFVKELSSSTGTMLEDKAFFSDLLGELYSKELYGILASIIYIPAICLRIDSTPEMIASNEKVSSIGNRLDRFKFDGLKEIFIRLVNVSLKRGIFNKLKNMNHNV